MRLFYITIFQLTPMYSNRYLNYSSYHFNLPRDMKIGDWKLTSLMLWFLTQPLAVLVRYWIALLFLPSVPRFQSLFIFFKVIRVHTGTFLCPLESQMRVATIFHVMLFRSYIHYSNHIIYFYIVNVFIHMIFLSCIFFIHIYFGILVQLSWSYFSIYR